MAFEDNIYEVNWNKLALWLTPSFLRNQRLLAFVYAALVPVNALYNRFSLHKNYLAYWTEIDSQIWRMEKALNDKYDIAERRIKIEDSTERLATPFYKPEENKQVVLTTTTEGGAIVLYTKNETDIFTNDFIVKVPVFVAFNATEMRAFIDTFKTPSKTYSISIV